MEPIAGRAKRGKECTCCKGGKIREMRRTGKPGEGPYAVAVCPRCDLMREPAKPKPAAS